MQKEPNAFKSVINATSIFGGVQFIKIIVSIVRSKVIAYLLGPAGIGISGLFVTALNLFTEFTSIGLDKSAVQEIAKAKEENDPKKISKTIAVLKRLVWFSVVMGCLLLVSFSPVISELSFDSEEFSVSFMLLAFALMFNQLSRADLAILQSFRNLSGLSKANVYGSVFGLIVTLPLYYFFGIDAIVPAMIVSAAIVFMIGHFFAKKLKYRRIQLTYKEAFKRGGKMLKLGAALSLSGIVNILGLYLLQVYITNTGSLDDLGFYNAGIMILNTYVGAAFTAMATDYYPQLAAIATNIKKVKDKVFEQAYIGVLLLVPVIVIFIAFGPFFITLLYSETFLPTTKLVSWGILGMLFKMGSFSMGYIIIAKADTSLFTKTILIFNALLLGLNILGFNYFGIEGLGISFLVYFIIHFIALLVITKFRYGFSFKNEFYTIFAIANAICIGSLLITYINSVLIRYILLILMVVLSITFSVFYINKKVSIADFIKEKINKK